MAKPLPSTPTDGNHSLIPRLHKIIKGQAGKDIIMGKNLNKFVEECMKRIYKLQNAGLKVIMVFDGGPLPRKAG